MILFSKNEPDVMEPEIEVLPDVAEPNFNPNEDPFYDPWKTPAPSIDPEPKF